MTYGFRILTLLLLVFSAQGPTTAIARETFPMWLEGLRQEAIAAGISETTASATVNHVQLLPNVVAMDRSQPEFISPFLNYYNKRVSARKIKNGREQLARHSALLNQIEAQYGVPKALLVSFWGMETDYGNNQGSIDTLSALATLAYDGRRAQFFRNQLLDAMRMMDAGHANVDEFSGSWAGAFGNMQFMPTTFMRYAVDGDKDGKIDVVNSLPDAFASASNYLAQAGWRTGEPAMIEVQLPAGFAWQDAQLTVRRPTDEWARLGVRALRAKDNASANYLMNTQLLTAPVVGKPFNKKAPIREIANKPWRNNGSHVVTLSALPNVGGQAAILLPQGWRGPAFMVFDNFDVIMEWNRSVNYALSVAQLAKLLNHKSHIIGGRLAEAGALSFEQMQELQAILNAGGFDAGVPDGLPGLKTQAAVRAYQLSRQMPADGYASPSLYESLRFQP